jgi:pimeloyl-ACP methyl ester carboxylesterase
MIIARDKTSIHYEDRGSGQPVLFTQDWPATPDAFEDQMLFLESRGYRCIAHDRRDLSEPVWSENELDTSADDLETLVRALGLSEAVHVGHGVGAGEIARYVGRYGSARVKKLVLSGLASLPSVTIDQIREDTKQIDVPALAIVGVHEEIEPDSAALRLFLTLNVDTTLRIYRAAPRGSRSPYKDRLNRDLLAFLQDVACP